MTPRLPNLRKLMGDDWVDAEIFGDKSTHFLGRWQQNVPDNAWVGHTEGLVGETLNNPKIALKLKTLKSKLKSEEDFLPTVTELEAAIFLANQGFRVMFEPMAPQKGPDLQVEWNATSYFIEIRAVGLSARDESREAATQEVFKKLADIPSAYFVTLTVADRYRSGSRQLKDATETIIKCLEALKGTSIKEAKLYFAAKDAAMMVLPGAESNGDSQRIRDNADFIAQFEHTGKEEANTRAGFLEKKKDLTEPVKDHLRLRNILQEKQAQLPKDSRGIILLDVSEQFMLSDFSIDRALYGDLRIGFARPVAKGEPVGEVVQSRDANGFLLSTSRVSAVMIQKRTVKHGENAGITSEWRVYPTNRADADTIRLTLEELRRFGAVEDRDHLSAENAP